MNKLNFRISSALKNLIGRELITDKYVAIFELVKNAYDAGASYAKIYFEDDSNGNYKKITIEDDGSGMNLSDIKEKWLFVGFSDKGKELLSEKENYRNTLRSRRFFAGAKGVGRFSCDRLGRMLNLETRKEGDDLHHLGVDWGNFEKNSLEEFSDVDINHTVVSGAKANKIIHGTILEITELRDEWNRSSILTLRKHLMKLINPVAVEVDPFSISIVAKAEENADAKVDSEYARVNGIVSNFVFESLPLKTTSIEIDISDDGKEICTELCDRGALVYRLRERCPEQYLLLKNIHVVIYQLNTLAKQTFTKIMGIAPVNFGSIFIYKNGFRIYPYGEPGDDSLGIDRRKQQGYLRNFGTREIIGRIELWGEQPEFNETTSRSGGIVQNDAYVQLLSFFQGLCLRRLERYAVDVVKWGEVDEDFSNLSNAKQIELTSKIFKIISRLAASEDVIDIEYNKNFIDIYNAAQAESSAKLSANLMEIARGTHDRTAARKIRAAARNIGELSASKKRAEQRAKSLEEEKKLVEESLDQKRKQVYFLSTLIEPDTDALLNCFHAIIAYSCAIQNRIDVYNSLSSTSLNLPACQESISAIQEANQKILLLSRFATKANFNSTAKHISSNIVQFIHEYVKELLAKVHHSRILLQSENSDINYTVKYSPLEIGLAIENLVSNSIKAKAKHARISYKLSDNSLIITYADDGKGIDPTVKDLSSVFERGYTTTDGSGLGLFQVKNAFSRIHGAVALEAPTGHGFKIVITIT